MRAIEIYTQRPEHARVVHRGTAVVRNGLSCTYEQDGHRLTLDMPVAIGGSDEGPTPGFFARAAICGCLAIGIKMTAARDGLHVDEVNVDIEQDWDNRGVLALAGASPVPGDTRIGIEVSSPESEASLRGLVARALAHDPWFLAYRDAQTVSTFVSIGQGVK
ncbi:OsmC family protein [Maritimibacter dapengensis]|uniref:OsmC family protein n=1 Tax=Maritimibacter dapengensis TaxID=2836868 RepID=A0ABS6T2W3_9RHOB|nr:OsmC family protein [Maritimibacter dapengensis]MBV7379599.1 OsmC family protein [Maritimibacter dapengensis]